MLTQQQTFSITLTFAKILLSKLFFVTYLFFNLLLNRWDRVINLAPFESLNVLQNNNNNFKILPNKVVVLSANNYRLQLKDLKFFLASYKLWQSLLFYGRDQITQMLLWKGMFLPLRLSKSRNLKRIPPTHQVAHTYIFHVLSAGGIFFLQRAKNSGNCIESWLRWSVSFVG